MAVNIEVVAEKVFNLLAGNGYDISNLNSKGEKVIDPQEATRFVVVNPNILVRLDPSTETLSMGVRETFDDDGLRDAFKHLAGDYLMNFDYRIFGKTLKPKSETIDIAKKSEKKMGDVLEAINDLRKRAGLEKLKEFRRLSKETYTASYEFLNMLVKRMGPEKLFTPQGKVYMVDRLYNSHVGIKLRDDAEQIVSDFMYVSKVGNVPYESIEEDEKDQFKGSTKNGHIYRAVADDMGASQYLKVFYGDGKFFRIYYDSNIVGGKAGGYDHTSVAPETNDPRADKVFADLPDNFFDKYGSEGERGLEDIIDMIKSSSESIEERKFEFGPDFSYDDEVGYDDNFILWYNENSSERRAYGEQPYSQEEGERVFQDMMKANGIDIARQKQLTKTLKAEKEKRDKERFQQDMEKYNKRKEMQMSEQWEKIDEGFSAMSGSTKTSYQGLDNVKLVIRHKKEVNEEVRGARSRNISSIFVQRGDERFKMAENNLKAARAMARHVKNGGEPFDTVGNAINEMAVEQRKLREFVRYVKKSGLVNEENETYVNLAMENINYITSAFTKLAGVKSYANAVEDVTDRRNTEVLEDDLDLESKFTETHFDDKVASVVDSIKSAMSRKTAFESYIDNAVSNESFTTLKNMLSEDDGMEFATPHAKLGYQVGQLSSSVTDSRLGNYLSGISKKLYSGDRMSQHEYTTVKSCLLGAHKTTPVSTSVAESVEDQFEKFIEQFDIL